MRTEVTPAPDALPGMWAHSGVRDWWSPGFFPCSGEGNARGQVAAACPARSQHRRPGQPPVPPVPEPVSALAQSPGRSFACVLLLFIPSVRAKREIKGRNESFTAS